MNDTGNIRVVEAREGAAHRDFLKLPLSLYSGMPGFGAPLLIERAAAIDPQKNPWFRHAEASFWVAYRNDEPVGRISAQVDRLAQERHGHDLGNFGYIDAIDDHAVYRALFDAAEPWLARRGVKRACGPFSLSINEETGLLVEGFDSRPMLLVGFHPPYAGKHVEAAGYAKVMDVIAYDYNVTTAAPIENEKLIERARNDMSITLRPLDLKRYREDLGLILEIFNDAWQDNWGFVPMTDAEIEHTAQELKQIIKPDLVWIAESEGEPISMIVCLPNVVEATADLNGRLLPFGWAKLLWRLKVAGVKSARVPLFGLRKRWHRSPHGAAIVFMLLDALRIHGRKHGIHHAELSWILENNWAIRKIIERVGGKPYKVHRVYEKHLSAAI